ncbi:YHYH domain-containing protein [Sphingomonas sp. 179-I 2A4 NHS]
MTPATGPKVKAPSKTPKAPQHSGGTDANGCHTNHSTGDYHCHKPK